MKPTSQYRTPDLYCCQLGVAVCCAPSFVSCWTTSAVVMRRASQPTHPSDNGTCALLASTGDLGVIGVLFGGGAGNECLDAATTGVSPPTP